MLCLNQLNSKYFYDYLFEAFGKPYKTEGGAYWFKAAGSNIWGMEITDVMVNGAGPVWVERAGRLVPSEVVLDVATIEHLLELAVAPLGLRVDRTSPLVDARLPDGSRLNAAVPPVALDGPCLTIRRFGARRGPVSREEVVAHDRPTFFSYRALSGPLPWSGYVSEVRLSPGPGGRGTAIAWTGSFRSRVPGLGTVIHRMVAGFARGLVAESERVHGGSRPG